MPFYRSIRSRRKRAGLKRHFELQLTSMMDVLIIIVVFLLKSYATSNNMFSSVPGLKMPISSSPDIPPDSLQLIITPESMTFENEKILEFTQTAANAGSTEGGYAFKPSDLDRHGHGIIPLYDALMKARDKAEQVRAKIPVRDKDGKPIPFEGVLAIQADKKVQYDTIRKIMYTAANAGYKIFRFLAMKKDT
jgi:biopolymer transport protein ExbD